jgi:hypothetical protein
MFFWWAVRHSAHAKWLLEQGVVTCTDFGGGPGTIEDMSTPCLVFWIQMSHCWVREEDKVKHTMLVYLTAYQQQFNIDWLSEVL